MEPEAEIINLKWGFNCRSVILDSINLTTSPFVKSFTLKIELYDFKYFMIHSVAPNWLST